MTASNEHNPAMYSHSAMASYRECALRYRYERVVHLTPRGHRDGHDAEYGRAAHRSMQALYEGRPLAEVGEVFKSAYPADRYPDPLPFYAQGKTQANFLAALWAYIKGPYQEDKENWEVLEVERTRTTEGLGEYSYDLTPDLIVRDRRDGMVYIIDHKFTAKYIADLWKQYEMSSQVRMYVDAVKARYGQVGGFIINAVSLRHRSRAYTPRSGPSKGVQLPAGDWFDMGRMAYAPNEDCLEMERANVRATADAIRHSIATDTWTYNARSCHTGLPFQCEYYQACSAGWSWPRDEEMVTEYYYQRCARQIAGEARCNQEAGHAGECSEQMPEDGGYGQQIVVEPADDEFYQAVEG